MITVQMLITIDYGNCQNASGTPLREQDLHLLLPDDLTELLKVFLPSNNWWKIQKYLVFLSQCIVQKSK